MVANGPTHLILKGWDSGQRTWGRSESPCPRHLPTL